MKDYIEERAIVLAEYIIHTKSTVRNAAKQFNVSKSTVHTGRVTLKLFIWKWLERVPFGDLTNFEIFRVHLYKNQKRKNPENRLNGGFQDFCCFSLGLSVLEF